MNRANKKRSILKTITWYALVLPVTLFTMNFSTLLISLVILYYLHERIWSYINWGFKNKNKKDKIMLLGNEVNI
jgi:uncharacterized membrane protein